VLCTQRTECHMEHMKITKVLNHSDAWSLFVMAIVKQNTFTSLKGTLTLQKDMKLHIFSITDHIFTANWWLYPLNELQTRPWPYIALCIQPYSHTNTHPHVYIRIYVCVCVCVYIYRYMNRVNGGKNYETSHYVLFTSLILLSLSRPNNFMSTSSSPKHTT
jgi:hypothetical protein